MGMDLVGAADRTAEVAGGSGPRSPAQPLEGPEAYADVGRRVCGNDGVIRPWSGEVK